MYVLGYITKTPYIKRKEDVKNEGEEEGEGGKKRTKKRAVVWYGQTKPHLTYTSTPPLTRQ